MSRTWCLAAVVALSAGLAAADGAAPNPDKPPRGAKALFGNGMRESFLPREEGGGARQMNSSANVTEEMLTGFYKTPEFPGMAYSVEVIRGGETNVISVQNPRTYEFATGDRIRIRLIPNYTGHAYVMQAKGEGSDELVYPVAYGTRENMVVAGRECYVPTSGWLRLTDPPRPFKMKVLFKPGADYPLNQPAPNPAVARVAIAEAVSREWRTQFGAKGIVFEADQSYVNTPAAPAGAAPAAAPPAVAPVAVSMPASMPTLDERPDYTTNYVAWSDAAAARQNPAIAIEIAINQVGSRYR